jgi:hypothetical protein
VVALIRPERLFSASPRRCVQTLDPLAELMDLPIEVASDLDEPEPGQHPDERTLAAAARLAELGGTGEPVAVCSQGKVIPAPWNGSAAGRTTSPPEGRRLAARLLTRRPPRRRSPVAVRVTRDSACLHPALGSCRL